MNVSRRRIVWASCLALVVVAGSGCRLPPFQGGRVAGKHSSEMLGTRYTRVTTSRLETGDAVLDELDDMILAINIDFNLPVSKFVDLQVFLGNREASGESVDPTVGLYEMAVTGWHYGIGVTGHSRPEAAIDPYLFAAAQYLVADVAYRDSTQVVAFDEDEVGWVGGGGIEWRPNSSIAVSPYIKYFDNGIFGEGTRVGGRIDTWLDQRWFLELSGETPISASGHQLGLGLGFRF